MKRTHALITAALLGGAIAAAPSAAQASQGCGNTPRASYFGTVTTVHPGYFTLRTHASMGSIHVYTREAHITGNGQALRPGVWAGVYGCAWESRDGLIAENVTLSAGRPAFTSNDRVIQGRIDAIQPGRVLIDSGSGHGDTWIEANTGGLQNGEFIRASGYFTPYDRVFVANSLAIVSGSGYNNGNRYWSNANVVEGRIDAVQPGRVLIEGNGGHGNVWVVTNARGLRTGELVRVTGAFNANDRAFLARSLTIESM